jgi:putative sigma-54 modulation protein
MKVTITARHCELSNEEKSFIEDRVNTLSRYYNRIMEAHVTVVGEKHRHKVEIKVNINNDVLFSETESPDLKLSIEQVIQKLQRQIKKRKGRFRRKAMNKEEIASMARESSIPPDPDEELAVDLAIDGIVEEMTLSEAVERVRAGTTSILFKDSSSGRTKAVHRRGDGRIDIMEMGPEDTE